MGKDAVSQPDSQKLERGTSSLPFVLVSTGSAHRKLKTLQFDRDPNVSWLEKQLWDDHLYCMAHERVMIRLRGTRPRGTKSAATPQEATARAVYLCSRQYAVSIQNMWALPEPPGAMSQIMLPVPPPLVATMKPRATTFSFECRPNISPLPTPERFSFSYPRI